jgi:hypothetical protein
MTIDYADYGSPSSIDQQGCAGGKFRCVGGEVKNGSLNQKKAEELVKSAHKICPYSVVLKICLSFLWTGFVDGMARPIEFWLVVFNM